MEEFLAKIMPFGVVIGSWTPTFALLFLFKKLYPGWSIKEFYKKAFEGRLNWKMLLFVAFVQLLIIIGASGIVALTREVSLLSLFDLSLKTLGIASISFGILPVHAFSNYWGILILQCVRITRFRAKLPIFPDG
jgi:hypothetical protein